MSKLTIALIVILLVLVVALVVLYFVGRKAQRRQIAQKEQMDAVAQTVSMLIIDKKKLRLSQSGLPEQVIEQTPKLLRRNKMPIVKAKVGPRIMTLACGAGDSPYGLIALLDKMVLAVLIDLYVYVAAELDDLRVLRTAELKGIAVHKPVVGNFFLISVLNFLLEHTIAVTDTAAVCRITQGCQRIQEASCQSSQTAISQSCIRLLILDYVQIAA